MKKIKSAFEIAMEKADQIDQEFTPEEKRMLKREEVKPLLAKFYNGKLTAEGLWERLKEEELLREAQLLLFDSLGLRTTEDQFKKRKEAILAIESLKTEQQSSLIEQAVDRIRQLQQNYTAERSRIEDMLESEMENAEMRLKPVRTRDGRTVMKMENSLDEETEKHFKDTLAQLEARSSQMLSQLLEEIKQAV